MVSAVASHPEGPGFWGGDGSFCAESAHSLHFCVDFPRQSKTWLFLTKSTDEDLDPVSKCCTETAHCSSEEDGSYAESKFSVHRVHGTNKASSSTSSSE